MLILYINNFNSHPCDSSLALSDLVEAEINSYLETPSTDKEEDPLEWWKLQNIISPQFKFFSVLCRKPHTHTPTLEALCLLSLTVTTTH